MLSMNGTRSGVATTRLSRIPASDMARFTVMFVELHNMYPTHVGVSVMPCCRSCCQKKMKKMKMMMKKKMTSSKQLQPDQPSMSTRNLLMSPIGSSAYV